MVGRIDRRTLLRSAAVAAAGPSALSSATLARAESASAAARLLDVPGRCRDTDWIKCALQIAVELELATIPPYLCAWWSVLDRGSEAAQLIQGIVLDEMYHMGTVCNLLVAVGGTPRITSKAPRYPGPLPGGVRQHLTVYLSGLTKQSVHDVMMAIEAPDKPLAREARQYSIGDFYTALLDAFEQARPTLSPQRQLSGHIGADQLIVVDSLDAVQASIEVVKEQGEGTAASPDVSFGQGAPAHYYAFGEIYHERRLRKINGVWEYSGSALPFPDARPMGVVPAGGWPSPPGHVQQLLHQFDQTYTAVLQHLESSWAAGDSRSLDTAVDAMRALEAPAIALMDIPLPEGQRTYGPQFRVLPPE